MATKKQNLARNRNWLKFRLSGTYIHMSEEALEATTKEERLLLEEIKQAREALLRNWDANSKSLGLNTSNK